MNYLVCLLVSVCIKHIYKSTGKIMRSVDACCSSSVNTGSYAGEERSTARERGMDMQGGVCHRKEREY